MARKWIRRLVFGLVLLGVVYFGAVFWIATVADARLEAELAEIRKRGEPLLLQEMAPPPVSDERNAAIPLHRAAELLIDRDPAQVGSIDAFLRSPRDWSEEYAQLSRQWVDRNRPTLEAIGEALERPACRFDYDYSSTEKMFEPGGPGMMEVMDCARLLVARGMLAARDGDTDQALADAARTLKLARCLSSDPLLLHALVRTACESMTLDLLMAGLGSGVPDDATRAELLAALDSIDLDAVLHEALLGERCFGNSLFSAFGEDRSILWSAETMSTGGAGSGLELSLFRMVPSAVIRLDQALYLQLMARTIELTSRPAFETREDWKKLERKARNAPWYALLSRLALFPMRGSYLRTEAHRARLDMARLALDLEHARAVTGTLPDALLSPGEGTSRGMIDPFSGEPYRYRTTEDGGYVIWSVGPNGKDDGGTDGAEDGYDSGDVIWSR